MSRFRTRRMIIAGILTLSPGVWAQGANPTDKAVTADNTARVRALYRKAQLLFAKENYEESRKLLLEAWALQPTGDVALALGQAEIELKLYRDCAEHLDYAIRNFSAVGSEKVLQAAKLALADTKTHIGQVIIMTNRDGADILVDGHVVGKSPRQSVVYVQPGRHEIRAQQDDSTGSEMFEVATGEAIEVSIQLRQSTAPSPTSPTSQVPTATTPFKPQTPTPVRETSERSIVPVIVGGAVFAVGLGTAIGLRLAANSKDSDAKALLQSMGAGGCAAPTSRTADCTTLLDTVRSGDRYANWSNVGFGVAGAALVATATYWLWPRTQASGATSGSSKLHFNVGASAGKSELWVTGEF